MGAWEHPRWHFLLGNSNLKEYISYSRRIICRVLWKKTHAHCQRRKRGCKCKNNLCISRANGDMAWTNKNVLGKQPLSAQLSQFVPRITCSDRQRWLIRRRKMLNKNSWVTLEINNRKEWLSFSVLFVLLCALENTPVMQHGSNYSKNVSQFSLKCLVMGCKIQFIKSALKPTMPLAL